MCVLGLFSERWQLTPFQIIVIIIFLYTECLQEDDFSSLDRTKQCVHTFSADLPLTGGRQTDNRMAWCSYDQCPMATGLFIFSSFTAHRDIPAVGNTTISELLSASFLNCLKVS